MIAEATDEGSRSAEEHDVTPSPNSSQRPRSPTGRKHYLTELTRLPLLIIDDLDMRKLPHDAAEDLLELVMRRYERTSTVLTWNRPVEDWGKLLGDTAAVTALFDWLLHHSHILKCGLAADSPRATGIRVVGG